ncbi:hypothetical protein MY11210_008138 [Beauveria gryllotalpidicola]
MNTNGNQRFNSCENLQGRLRRWALDLKVWDQHGSSLDSQLDSSPQFLRLFVDFQLGALKIHLSRVEPLMTLLRLPLLLTSKTAGTTSEELPGDNFWVLLGKINSTLDQINFTLDRLQRFAANFLYHTETGLGVKVRDYRRRHDDSTFSKSVQSYVQSHYPLIGQSQYRYSGLKRYSEPAETSCEAGQAAKDQPADLHGTLVNMILFRHYRTLYEREQREAPPALLPEKKPSRGSQAMDTVARRASALVDTARQKGTKIAAFATSLSESPSDGYQIAVRDLNLRESVLSRHLQQNQANANRPCTGEENLTCPVCDQVYHSGALGGENWKRHFIIVEDSKPTTARDDSRCSEEYSASLYNGSEWKGRLRQRHGTEWLPLRVPLFWTCSLCCRVPRMEKLSRALMMDALISHMQDAAREKAGGQAAPSSIGIGIGIGWTSVLLMPPSETCPICGTCHLDSLPTDDDAAGLLLQTDAQARDTAQEAMDVAWKKTEDCIGKHVLEMALHFAGYRAPEPTAAAVPDTIDRADKMTLLARKSFKKAAKRLSTVTQGIRL